MAITALWYELCNFLEHWYWKSHHKTPIDVSCFSRSIVYLCVGTSVSVMWLLVLEQNHTHATLRKIIFLIFSAFFSSLLSLLQPQLFLFWHLFVSPFFSVFLSFGSEVIYLSSHLLNDTQTYYVTNPCVCVRCNPCRTFTCAAIPFTATKNWVLLFK